MSKPPALRADAARNRERLLAIATEHFACGDTNVSLDSIARGAGVGIGTLYRHFPTRESLVEQVYRCELEALVAGAADLLDKYEPLEALRRWMSSYVRFVTAKRAMQEALLAALASRPGPGPGTRARVAGAIELLMSAGKLEGSLRPDIMADDVTLALSGIVLATCALTDQEQLARLLDLLIRGLRT